MTIMKSRKSSTSKARKAPSTVALRGIRSLLVPIDFSPESKRALEYAVPLAKSFGGKLTLVHVVEPVATPDFAQTFPLLAADDKLMAAARDELDRVVRRFGGKSKLFEKTLVRFGRAFHEITEVARTRKADLIVITTHGYTGLKHAFLGSTAERVVRHAPCAVLVVR